MVNGDVNDSFGADADYYALYKHGKLQVGAGLVNNLSEANSIQAFNVNGTLNGWNNYNMHKEVPAYNFNAQAALGAFTLTGEFIGTSTGYDIQDLSFNGKPAHLSALHIEGMYAYVCKPSI